MIKAEEHNLKEEIREKVSIALKKGIDNDGCAIFKVMRKEQYSPKGKAVMLDNGFYENILNNCNLCRACGDELCDVFRKARRVLVLKGKEIEVNKKIVENINKSGNIYGL